MKLKLTKTMLLTYITIPIETGDCLTAEDTKGRCTRICCQLHVATATILLVSEAEKQAERKKNTENW